MINLSECDEAEREKLIAEINKMSMELLLGKPYVSELEKEKETIENVDDDGLPIADQNQRNKEKKKRRKKRN